MELALSEQLKGRQEMEKRLQKLGKTMDHLERAKREEAAPLIEAAFQRRLSEEKVLHEHEQQQEIELSRLHHDGDLKEKNRLLRILENKEQLQNKVVKCRQNEYERLRVERDERNNQILRARKDERESKRKMLYFLSTEEERLKKLQEEEEARKIKEAERLKKEEAEKRARLDKIAEIQRQREQEIEERRRGSEGLARSSEHPRGSRPLESPDAVPEAAPAAAAAPTPGQYVPRFRRAEGQAPPPEPDRWGSGRQDDRVPTPGGDRWRSGGGQRSSGAAWIPPRAG